MELDKRGSLHFAWMEGTNQRTKERKEGSSSVDFDFSIDPITLRKKDRQREKDRKLSTFSGSGYFNLLLFHFNTMSHPCVGDIVNLFKSLKI